MSNELPSKDQFFEQLGSISDAMIAAYGKDFAMGALVLAARFIVERKSSDDNATAVIYTGEGRAGVGQ